ncbi:IS1595 family transposase [Cohnella hashimotonis]|uniref:IS1595 family transposase n=1 Tax=Cohnella hashimotonis TaxID=2826895 RepID=A0ABT6THV6_9BACL|nr:IS1595 family transposase [Cohnella hashimotonis]MDI4646319.1 IS1595 family transposase [Cohnella hashimotonis]
MTSRISIRDSLPVYSEDDCESALFAAKWPHGFRCPRCAHPYYYEVSSRGRRLFECRSCRHQTSITAGTVLEGSRTPLTKWFHAMYLMQLGISAKLLAELIQVTYKTAWLINHKLRHAIGQWDRDRPLEGAVQLLGEYYGYEYHRHLGSSNAQQTLKPQPIVVGATLDESDQFVHLKMKAVDGPEGNDTTRRGVADGEEAAERFVQRHVAGGLAAGHMKKLEPGHRGRSPLHFAWREAVKWLSWTFGGIGPKHLQAYLNEFCFRLTCRGALLAELIGCCGTRNRITYRGLVGPRSGIRPLKWGYRRPAQQQDRRAV